MLNKATAGFVVGVVAIRVRVEQCNCRIQIRSLARKEMVHNPGRAALMSPSDSCRPDPLGFQV